MATNVILRPNNQDVEEKTNCFRFYGSPLTLPYYNYGEKTITFLLTLKRTLLGGREKYKASNSFQSIHFCNPETNLIPRLLWNSLSLSHYGVLASSVSCLFTPPCNKPFGVGGVGSQGMADNSNYQEDK